MSERPQPGMPFGFGQFDFSQVLRFLESEGPLNFEVARQVAAWVAGQAETTPPGTDAPPSLPPGDDRSLVEIARAAHLRVTQITGLGRDLDPEPRLVDRTAWANETLDGLKPVLETLARRLTDAAGDEAEASPADAGDDPFASALGGAFGMPADADLGGLMRGLGPLLLGVQAGFMVGHLSTLVLARYEMPLPLDAPPRVVLLPRNLGEFEAGWELPGDELRFYVALHEVVHAAARSVAWVQERLLADALAFVEAFTLDTTIVEDRLTGLDPDDPASIERAVGDPAELLGAMRTPEQLAARARLTTTAALLEGYADAVLTAAAPGLMPSFDRIREASHRHRIERGDAGRFLETLLGLDAGRDDYDRASAFWRGVVERAPDDGLHLLWTGPERFPTPAELEAPGLWLERIRLPD